MTLSPDPRWQQALSHSHYLRQLCERRPQIIEILHGTWEKPLTADDLANKMAHLRIDGEESLFAALRHLRQQVFAHLMLRDLCAGAPLAEIVETMTALADVTTNLALDFIHRDLVNRYGEPLDAQGEPQRLLIVGMGKLGGRELNVSSDVDYIFVYPEDGETAGPRKIDNFDFFTRLGKRLIAALDDMTADGQVFRVDMRLRPNGDSGALVTSFNALEHYFITQGREWERYAWIKARVMNHGDNLQREWRRTLVKIANPFIFRKYLDYGAINAMRDLHGQIRREVARKDMADHVKLGPGGIREIEFIAQVFQLIRGGRDLALQIRPTLAVLERLRERRLLPDETVDQLTDAYVFLRQLEHRLQYVDDRQTHRLPTTADEQQQIAVSMGFADWTAFMQALDVHRSRTSQHFEAVFSDPVEGEHPLAPLWLGQIDRDDQLERLSELGFRQAGQVADALGEFRSSHRYQQLPASNRERLDAVGPRLIEAAAQGKTPDNTLIRGLGFLEAINRRGAYLAFLQQYPQALAKVAHLIGNSSWAAEYLTRHPILLDELIDPRLLDVATDWQGFRQDLAKTLAAANGDTEREMDILREMHHAQVFRLLVQDLSGVLPLETLSDHLTELADILLEAILHLCWSKLKTRHCETPRLAVIGYGKLGGKELGYASDLDLVFIYDDDHPDAPETYTRLIQRINTWCSSQTAAGILFETDLRLRPNGDAGTLACPVEAFRDYQQKDAWVWEHQALTRARFCVGNPDIGEKFESIRIEILTFERDLDKLRDEVVAMRQKMLDAHASNSQDEFDIKHDPGGIVDVEFIVQYLVLGNAHRFTALTGNKGNIALLKMAADFGLIPPEQAELTRNAYREYRRLQHQKRLNGTPKARVERELVAGHIEAVRTLWNTVLV